MKHPRPRIACFQCGKVCGIHADGTLWAHTRKGFGLYPSRCPGSDRAWNDHLIYADPEVTKAAHE